MHFNLDLKLKLINRIFEPLLVSQCWIQLRFIKILADLDPPRIWLWSRLINVNFAFIIPPRSSSELLCIPVRFSSPLNTVWFSSNSILFIIRSSGFNFSYSDNFKLKFLSDPFQMFLLFVFTYRSLIGLTKPKWSLLSPRKP